MTRRPEMPKTINRERLIRKLLLRAMRKVNDATDALLRPEPNTAWALRMLARAQEVRDVAEILADGDAP